MTNSVKLSRLSSGLTVVTEHIRHMETVAFGAYVAAGTRHETAEENGVSHFLEHMAFKGTENRTALRIAEEIENVGGYINAYTAREHTAFYVKLLKENLDLGIDIIGDILTHSLFDSTELERERGVVLQEIRQANDMPDDIVFDYFLGTAFPSQPMGRPTLGTEESVSTMPRETLTHYMATHYTPENIIIGAAGNLTHDAVVEKVQASFADLKTSSLPMAVPACYRGGEFRQEKELDQAHILLGFPSMEYKSKDYYSILLLSTLLGGGMSSRLFQEVREKRSLVYSVYSFNTSFKDSGIFGIYAGTGEQECAELFPVVLEELRKVQRHVHHEELTRAQAQLKASLLMSLESTSNRCERIARRLQNFGRVIPIEETIRHIDAVTTDDICRVATAVFSGTPTLSAIGPICKIPSLDTITKTLAA
ncbi:MAG: insulinase family protein [Acetobacter sp.]|nr:insulinase family protein [Acetobacter sp.]